MQVLSRRQIPKNGDHDGLHLLRTGIQCRTQLCECVQKCSGQQKCITKIAKRLNGQERGKNVLSQTCWVSFYHLYIAHQLKTLKQGMQVPSVKLVDGSRSYMLTVPRTPTYQNNESCQQMRMLVGFPLSRSMEPRLPVQQGEKIG